MVVYGSKGKGKGWSSANWGGDWGGDWDGYDSGYGGGNDMNQMMEMMMYGMMMGMQASKGKGKGGSKGKGEGQAQAQKKSPASIKSALYSACMKKHKTEFTKEDLTFTTEVADGEWTCTIVSNLFTDTYQSEARSSKREAEEDAAKQALQGEFPEALSNIPKASKAAKAPKAAKAAKAASIEDIVINDNHSHEKNFRNRLNETLMKLGKEQPSYTSENVRGENPGYRVTVSCGAFKVQTSYTSDGHARNLRVSEENAAMNAFRSEFPTLYEATPQSVKDNAKDMSARPEKEAPPYKITFGDGPGSLPNFKSRVHGGVSLLIGRGVEKGELVFDTEPATDGHRCTLKISCPEIEDRTFKGSICPGKKEAEESACAMCWKAMKKDIFGVFDEREAQRAEKKAKQDAQKEARRAEKSAANEKAAPPAKKPRKK